MSNAIVLITGASSGLSEIEEMILAESGNDERAFETIPTKITIAPGGIGAFATSDGETMKTLSGVVAVAQIVRAYWPEKGSRRPPLCSSPDGVSGILNADPDIEQVRAAATAAMPHLALRLQDAGQPVPTHFACAECPMSQWGSAHQDGKVGGKSQACKELRRLVLLVDGWAQPALLTLPPTSIKTWDAFCSMQQRNRSAYWALRVTISLEKQASAGGDPYSVVVITPKEKLADKTLLQAVIAIRREYETLVRSMGITPDEYRTTPAENGEVVEGEAQPFL